MLLIALLFVTVLACDQEEAPALWKFFQRRWPREYGRFESTVRYEIFCQNVKKAKELNDLHPETTYGVTKFMDLTPKEFQSRLMTPFDRESYLSRTQAPLITDYNFGNTTPTTWNWKDHGAVTEIKNQLQCGSCWAFSAVENIEGQWALGGHPLISLSEQQVVDCDTVDKGCNGGLMDQAFQYVIKAGGIETETDYPYEGIQDSCKVDTSKFVAKISSYVDLEHDEGKMLDWCYQNGPISIALNANDLQYYTSGIFDPLFCNPKALDHGLLIVGWGVHKGTFQTQNFWTIKNSWGQDWGEDGFFRMVRGKNKCGVAEVPCSSRL